MKQINRRINAMQSVQEAIIELGRIIEADRHLNEMLTSLREVRKELAYEIFRADPPDEEMSDDEKARRCDEAYNKSLEAPDWSYPPICVVDGSEYTLCRTCPLWRE